MLSRADLDIDMDPTAMKVRRQGYVPITGRQSLAEFAESTAGSANPRLTCRLDKGHVQMKRTLPRSDTQSIYTHGRDSTLQRWLDGAPNQIESLDHTKVQSNFGLLGGRLGHLDQRALKFSYKKPTSSIDNHYDSNRTDFFS